MLSNLLVYFQFGTRVRTVFPLLLSFGSRAINLQVLRNFNYGISCKLSEQQENHEVLKCGNYQDYLLCYL